MKALIVNLYCIRASRLSIERKTTTCNDKPEIFKILFQISQHLLSIVHLQSRSKTITIDSDSSQGLYLDVINIAEISKESFYRIQHLLMKLHLSSKTYILPVAILSSAPRNKLSFLLKVCFLVIRMENQSLQYFCT